MATERQIRKLSDSIPFVEIPNLELEDSNFFTRTALFAIALGHHVKKNSNTLQLLKKSKSSPLRTVTPSTLRPAPPHPPNFRAKVTGVDWRVGGDTKTFSPDEFAGSTLRFSNSSMVYEESRDSA